MRRDKAEMRRNVARVCEQFPVLGERLAQRAGSLSGGEQQMLAVARALVARPSVLLLDEPSMGLVPKVVEEVLAIVSGLGKIGMTVLLVEQNPRIALEVAQRACIMESDEIVLEGGMDALRQNEAVFRAYFGAGAAE